MFFIILYIHVYNTNSWESNYRDGPTDHNKINEARQADGVEEKVNNEDDDPQLMVKLKQL